MSYLGDRSVATDRSATPVPFVSQPDGEFFDDESRERPLGTHHIRIVRLWPAERTAQAIRCTRHTISFDSPYSQQYEALSYAWGNVSDTRRVRVDGHGLHVTKNLYLALRRLRYVDRCRNLWIDQISINQRDTREKNHQVALMAQIFSVAAQVIVWLGDRDYETTFRLLRSPQYFPDIQRALMAYRHETSDSGSITHMEIHNDLDHALDMIQSAWFSRVWILQEVSRARDVVLVSGQDSAPWANFAQLLRMIRRFKECSRQKERALKVALNVVDLRDQHGDLSPSQLLLAGQYSRSTDAKDQIYALLPLADSDTSALNVRQLAFSIPVDYSKWTVELYAQTTRLVIEEGGSLMVLGLLERGKKRQDLPSWVPDYSEVTTTLPLIELVREGYTLDMTRFEFMIGDDSDWQYLSLQGVRIATLKGVGLPLVDSEEIIPEVLSTWAKLATTTGVYPTRDCAMIAFAQTMLMGTREQVLTTTATDDDLGFDIWYEYVCEPDLIRQSAAVIRSRFGALTMRWCESRRFAVTKQGDYCIVPAAAKPNDIILLLNGGELPFVARWCRKGFELIGECYIHNVNLDACMEQNRWRSFTFV